MRGVAAGLAVLVLVASPAGAASRPELDGPTQLDMNAQALARLRVADAELNRVYKRVAAGATPAGRQRLRAAQRAWITFRDLDCEARSGARGGSMRQMIVFACLEAVTDARAATLKSLLDCSEGDTSCSGHRD